MTDAVRIDHLCHHPQRVPAVARLIYDEFWSDGQGLTLDFLTEHLRGTGPHRIPLSLIALAGDELIGTVNLIDNDDAKRTHLHPWLAAMVVTQPWRGRGVGSRLVRELMAQGRGLGFTEFYLGTDGPGFYIRLGAQLHEQITQDFCILRLPLGETFS